jgi:hypothetical protein
MRYCPNCLRHSIPDVIGAFHYASVIVGPFTICGFCGWWLQDQPKEATA